MKKLFFIFLVIVSVALKAQTFTVGDTSCNYVRVDSVLRCYQIGMGAWSMIKSYSFDLDGDMINDISLFNAHNGSSPGSSSHQHGVFTCTSTTGVQFVYNTSPTSCWTGAMSLVSNLTLGSQLTASQNWGMATNRNVFDFDKLYWSVGSYYCGHVTQFGGTTVYVGFRKVLIGDTIYGWLKLKTTIYGTDVVDSYAYKHTATNNTITPVFTNTLASIICEGSTFSLSASPSGGNFYGTGVTGNIFNSGITGSGMHNVYYTQGCVPPAVLSVSVTAAPTSTFTNPTTVCNGDTLLLSASPPGGVFGGLGVTGNVFHSSVTGPGIKIVSYTYTDGNGCSGTKTSTIGVVAAPILSITQNPLYACPGESLTLTANGATTYTWNTSSTTPTCIVSPSVNTIYSVTGTISPGCVGTNTYAVNVGLNLLASPSNATVCLESSITLTATGAYSYTWSNGSNFPTTAFSPSFAVTYSVVGSGPGGCSDTAYVNITMDSTNNLITVITNDSIICSGDTATLLLSGSGSWYYMISLDGLEMYNSLTNDSLIQLNPTVTTTYVLYGENFLPNGCYIVGYYTQYVSSCVGINELDNTKDHLTIFPNPNNGEFEIKGIKEETIFITNELGQLVSTKNLTQENNYSVKLNNLQNGVYFVGNKFSRQKIVVIK